MSPTLTRETLRRKNSCWPMVQRAHPSWWGKHGVLSITARKAWLIVHHGGEDMAYWPSWWGSCGSRSLRQLVIQHLQSGSRGRGMLCSGHFLLFLSPVLHPVAGFLSSRSIVFKDQLTCSLFAARLFFSLPLHVLFLSCFPSSVVQVLLPEHVTGTLSIQCTFWMLKSSYETNY